MRGLGEIHRRYLRDRVRPGVSPFPARRYQANIVCGDRSACFRRRIPRLTPKSGDGRQIATLSSADACIFGEYPARAAGCVHLLYEFLTVLMWLLPLGISPFPSITSISSPSPI